MPSVLYERRDSFTVITLNHPEKLNALSREMILALSDIFKIRADMVHLEEGQQRLEQGQEFLRGEMREMRTQLRDFSRKFSVFNDTLTQIQADYRDIYDRVRELELGRN